MAETTKIWVDTGSGPGKEQTVPLTPVMKAKAAYREFLSHTDECEGSCMAGVNCDEAIRLQRAWRDAKNEALRQRSG